MTKPRFVVGPKALGDAFIGRKKEVDELGDAIYRGKGSVSLVGPTRIGKSSLVKTVLERNRDQENCIQIEVNMATRSSAYHFWSYIWKSLYTKLREAGVWNAYMEEDYIQFAGLTEEEDWYSRMSDFLPNILCEMIDAGYRWVLVIDEFDAVSRVFGEKEWLYQFLRDIFAESYKANGVVISRQTIESLENTNPSISTLHGVFDMRNLKGFSAKDMDEFYSALSAYGIELTDSGKTCFKYYTGHIPYLCCMFASRMIEQREQRSRYKAKDIVTVFSGLLPQIEIYFQDLDSRLKKDGHWESLIHLCVGSPLVLKNERLKDAMMAMGYLDCEMVNGVDRYYAYSQDYMQHILGQQLNLPIWDNIMAAERKLKSLFGKVYPALASATPAEDWFTEADQQRTENSCPGFRFGGWDWIIRDCEKTAARKGTPATILEAISLGPIVSAIVWDRNWNGRFSVFFRNDFWKDRLRLISAIRDPLAHNQGHYITKEELVACGTYCDELLKLDMGPDIHP